MPEEGTVYSCAKQEQSHTGQCTLTAHMRVLRHAECTVSQPRNISADIRNIHVQGSISTDNDFPLWAHNTYMNKTIDCTADGIFVTQTSQHGVKDSSIR